MVRSLPRQPTIGLDAKRIAANCFVIALHVAALMLLMVPMTWNPPKIVENTTPTVIVPEVIKIKPLDPIPVSPDPKPQPKPRSEQTLQPPLTTQLQTNTEIIDPTGTEFTETVDDSDQIIEQIIESGSGEPAVLALTLLHGPAPIYPPQAVRTRLQGEVLLRVLVAADGRPQEVLIERSSGHRLLDQAAIREVMASWRFQPAMVEGHQVSAYALVPIHFRLAN